MLLDIFEVILLLNVYIVCIGKLKEKYLADACNEYIKRLAAFCKINVVELPLTPISNSPSQAEINATIKDEGKRMLSKIPNGSKIISMCIEGKLKSSEELSDMISDLAVNGSSTITFVIGGSYGLSDEIKQKSHLKLSMSKMTFPHQIARLMLLEQIYRSFQIMNNGKYHK